MKKWIIPSICVVCAIYLLVNFFSSHKGVTYVSIGKTYNKFLFFPAKSAHFTITFKSSYTGSLTLIDDKGSALPASKYTIMVDGKNSGPSFSVKNKRLVNVSIRCSKAVSSGKQYVQVKGGGPLVTHVYFTHHPLEQIIILKSQFFPSFSFPHQGEPQAKTPSGLTAIIVLSPFTTKEDSIFSNHFSLQFSYIK